MIEQPIRFITADGEVVKSGGLMPRHFARGDTITTGGTLDAPARKYRVLDVPALHHGFDSFGQHWISTYIVEPIE